MTSDNPANSCSTVRLLFITGWLVRPDSSTPEEVGQVKGHQSFEIVRLEVGPQVDMSF